MAAIVVAGAGVAGLGTALFAARRGHHVVLVERDDTPLPPDPDGAFRWRRRGAPQVRHSHAFLARLRNLLRDRHPDVLAALFDAGVSELDFVAMLPPELDPTPRPGDEDLVALACRRTTFEWVLRRLALATEGLELRHGSTVASLGAEEDRSGSIPRVDRVVLDDGTELRGDVVVLAGGRRADVPALLAPLGVEVPETVEDTGIVYFSRFLRLLDGAEPAPQEGPIAGDLGYLKFAVFPGDDRTFSITLAVHADDTEMRRALLDPDRFLATAAQLPTTAPHVEADRATPITGVEVMGGLVNQRRTFTDDAGAPRALGVHAVGDAHTCTNPLYGRGCSLALLQAQLLVDALDEHGAGDADRDQARAVAYEAASDAEVLPWYRAAVAQDRMDRAAAIQEKADRAAAIQEKADRAAAIQEEADRAAAIGEPAAPSADAVTSTATGPSAVVDPAQFARELMREGLLPALRVDPVVVRAFLRMFNLLSPPDALLSDPDVVGRVLAVYQARDQRPPEPPPGPPRDQLLARL